MNKPQTTNHKPQTEIKIVGFFCVLVFILGLIFPVAYHDDSLYALGINLPDFREGGIYTATQRSIFQQQFYEYLTWHGRFFTHILARIVLQNRFTADLLYSFFVGLFLYASWKVVNLQNSPEIRQKQISLLWVMCLCLIMFFLMWGGIWFKMIRVVHFMSYRLTFTILLFFLIPYLRFFADDNKAPQMILFSVVSLIAGSTHEQCVVLIPILILTGIVYSYFLKKKLPSWYYIGIVFFFIGILTILLSPYTFSQDRLIGYGNATNWDFFGQKINWLELGWKKYFYSLAIILYKWLPHSVVWIVFFVVIFIKLLKERKYFSYNLIPSIVLFVISQAIVVVLMFTPKTSVIPMGLGLDFLIVSCFSILSIYLNTINFDFKKYEKKIITTIIAITLITWTACIPFSVRYRLDLEQRIKIANEAIKNNQSEVYIKAFPYSKQVHRDQAILQLMYRGITNINIIIE